MSKQIYPIRPCPFCKNTAKFTLWFNISETWLSQIKCENLKCEIQPKGKYIPIRKSQKKDPTILKSKIEKTINQWNNIAPFEAYEGIELDFEEIAKMSEKNENHGNPYSSYDFTQIKSAIDTLSFYGYEIKEPSTNL